MTQNSPKYEPHFYGPVKGIVIGDNNTVTFTFQSGEDFTVPFLAPPLPPYELVGREIMLSSLKQQLFGGGSLAISALNGLPGVGKTALAVALAHNQGVLNYFHDGVLWAGLGRQGNAFSLLGNWALALGLSSVQVAGLLSLEVRAKAIRLKIGMRRMLLVVDDAWRPDDALAFKVGGPNCAHLVTTRLPEVAEYFAGPQVTTVRELDEADGLSLLMRIAPKIVDAEPDIARRLVRAVGGLPLGLIVMGNYLRIQARNGQSRRTEAALERLQQIEERLQLSQPQSPLERQPSLPPGASISLEAIIAVSDEALDEVSRHALRTLSVFPPKPNTFSEKAALAVTTKSAKILDKLADFGLLESGKPGRYTLHQTITDYAGKYNYDETAYDRMVVHFAQFVNIHKVDYDVLDIETKNIVAALDIASKRQMTTNLITGVNDFHSFLESRGSYDLAEIYLRRAEQSARSLEDVNGLASTLHNLGRIAQRRGDYKQANNYWQEGLAMTKQSGNDEIASALLTDLGVAASDRDDFDQAEKFLQDGLALARSNNNPERISIILGNLGRLAFFHEKYKQARTYIKEALTLARQYKYRNQHSSLLVTLGGLSYKKGDLEQANIQWQEGLKIARQLGNLEKISTFLTNLGAIANERGDYEEAEEFLKEGLVISQQLGHSSRMSHLLMDLGLLANYRSDSLKADTLLQEGLELARKIENWPLAAHILMKWGEINIQRKQWNDATKCFLECLELAPITGIEEQEQTGTAYYGLARIAAAQGNKEEVNHYAQQSLMAFEAIEHHRAMEVKRWLVEYLQ